MLSTIFITVPYLDRNMPRYILNTEEKLWHFLCQSNGLSGQIPRFSCQNAFQIPCYTLISLVILNICWLSPVMEGKACIQQYVHKCSGVSSSLLNCLTPAVFNGSLVPLGATVGYCLSSCIDVKPGKRGQETER